ncbi:MAG: alpha/beta hydrolase, partial [Chloroflexota bacterium]
MRSEPRPRHTGAAACLLALTLVAGALPVTAAGSPAPVGGTSPSLPAVALSSPAAGAPVAAPAASGTPAASCPLAAPGHASPGPVAPSPSATAGATTAATPAASVPCADGTSALPSAGAPAASPLGLPGGSPSPSASPVPSASPSPLPTATPGPVRPGRVRRVTGLAMTPRLPCYEFPVGGCVNRADVYYPTNPGGWPTIVAIHGRPRTPADMAEISRALAARGAVVFNVDYRGVRPVSRGFPDAIVDVACAVRFAKERTARFGGDPEHVVLVGHSQGGYVGMMVSIVGDTFPGRKGDCRAGPGSPLPDGFVPVAG